MKRYRNLRYARAFGLGAVMLMFAVSTSAEPAGWQFGELNLLASGLRYPEGPTLDRAGNLYVVEYETNRVIKITPDGAVSTFLEAGVRNNGLIRDARGNFFIADWKGRAIYRADTNGAVSLVADRTSDGDSLRGPNDFAWDLRGNLYFTDPKGSSADNPVGEIHFLDSDLKIHRFAGGLVYPNGLAFDRDGTHLYVGETHINRIVRFEVRPDGTAGAMAVFFQMGEGVWPDGMKVDEEGNLWVTAWTEKEVWCISPAGEKIAAIRLPGQQPRPTNILFGGPDRKTAYITVNEGRNGRVYTIRMPVAGLPVIPGE